MPKCEKAISTENGVLTCDKNAGHPGLHHAASKGGRLPAVDNSKTKDGEPIFREGVAPLNVTWPAEGMNDPVTIKRG